MGLIWTGFGFGEEFDRSRLWGRGCNMHRPGNIIIGVQWHPVC